MITGRGVLLVALLGGASLSAEAQPVQACQACLEDKIAATYDWQVVTTATRQGHTVVFTAIQPALAPGDKRLERRLGQSVAEVPGVDQGTVRVSLSPPALAFAADLRRHKVDALVQAVNQRLHALGVSLAIVRVGAPAEGAMVARRSP